MIMSMTHYFSVCFFFSLVYLDFSQANFSFAPLVLDMLNFLMDAIQTNFQQASAVGSSSRAQQALRELHTVEKVVEMTDQLMVSVRWVGVGTSLLTEMPKCARVSGVSLEQASPGLSELRTSGSLTAGVKTSTWGVFSEDVIWTNPENRSPFQFIYINELPRCENLHLEAVYDS